MIVVPGLGDEVNRLRWLTNHWRKHGLEPIVTSAGWYDGEPFQPKLKRLLDLIDRLTRKKNIVSLVGTSAGGSAVINAFCQRRRNVHRVVSVCGRLRIGTQRGARSFKARTASSPSFAQSVKLCEKNISTLTAADKKKIMTIRAMFGDELVPANTTVIPGAYNTQVPTPEHVLTIAAALTVFSNPLFDFLTRKLS